VFRWYSKKIDLCNPANYLSFGEVWLPFHPNQQNISSHITPYLNELIPHIFILSLTTCVLRKSSQVQYTHGEEMITLHPQPVFTKPVINTPAFARRNAENRNDFALTPQQIRIESMRIASGGISQRVWRILDLLSTGGILSRDRLPAVSDRKMREWCNTRLFERLSLEADEVRSNYVELGLGDSKISDLYLLGPVGVEIATTRHGVMPPAGYQMYTPMRIMHDVAVNEVVMRLAEKIGGLGWTVDWLGKYESTLTDKNGKTILEPDALIRFRKDGKEGGDGAFALEYHNEDWQTRAATKVEKYEKAFLEGNWRDQWEVETFPPVLAVFHKAIVGVGYQNATQKGNKKLNCVYYGKPLKSVLEGKLDEWVNVGSNMKRETILPK